MKLDEILKEAPFYDEPERDRAGEYDETDPERHVERDWDDYDDNDDDMFDEEGNRRFRGGRITRELDPDEQEDIRREQEQRQREMDRLKPIIDRQQEQYRKERERRMQRMLAREQRR